MLFNIQRSFCSKFARSDLHCKIISNFSLPFYLLKLLLAPPTHPKETLSRSRQVKLIKECNVVLCMSMRSPVKRQTNFRTWSNYNTSALNFSCRASFNEWRCNSVMTNLSPLIFFVFFVIMTHYSCFVIYFLPNILWIFFSRPWLRIYREIPSKRSFRSETC